MPHGHAFGDIATGLPMRLRTVSNWLDRLIRRRFAWLWGHHVAGRGRKATLPADHRHRLDALRATGPLEAGCPSGVGPSRLIAGVIERAGGVTSHPRSVGRLLPHLGLTDQHAAGVSAKRADEEHERPRKTGAQETWPAI
jgi:transposase